MRKLLSHSIAVLFCCQAGGDDRIPLIVQLPGAGWLTAITVLAAIGDITRFPSARKLVGYAGLALRRAARVCVQTGAMARRVAAVFGVAVNPVVNDLN